MLSANLAGAAPSASAVVLSDFGFEPLGSADGQGDSVIVRSAMAVQALAPGAFPLQLRLAVWAVAESPP